MPKKLLIFGQFFIILSFYYCMVNSVYTNNEVSNFYNDYVKTYSNGSNASIAKNADALTPPAAPVSSLAHTPKNDSFELQNDQNEYFDLGHKKVARILDRQADKVEDIFGIQADKDGKNKKSTKRTLIKAGIVAVGLLAASIVLKKTKLSDKAFELIKEQIGKNERGTKFLNNLNSAKETAGNVTGNMTNVKDAFFQKVWNFTIPGTNKQPLKWIEKHTSKLYSGMGAKTVQGGYDAGEKQFNKFYNQIVEKFGENSDEAKKLLEAKKSIHSLTSGFGDRFKDLEKTVDGMDVPLHVRKTIYDSFKNPEIQTKGIKGIFEKARSTAVKFKNNFSKSLMAGEPISDTKNARAKDITKKIDDIFNGLDDVVKGDLKKRGQLDAVRSKFNKTAKLETEDLIDKLRDIKAGCAPTDFTVDTGVAVGAVALATLKPKPGTSEVERKHNFAIGSSAAVMGVVTKMLAATKMINGGPAYGFGIAVAAIVATISKNISKVIMKNNNPEIYEKVYGNKKNNKKEAVEMKTTQA